MNKSPPPGPFTSLSLSLNLQVSITLASKSGVLLLTSPSSLPSPSHRRYPSPSQERSALLVQVQLPGVEYSCRRRPKYIKSGVLFPSFPQRSSPFSTIPVFAIRLRYPASTSLLRLNLSALSLTSRFTLFSSATTYSLQVLYIPSLALPNTSLLYLPYLFPTLPYQPTTLHYRTTSDPAPFTSHFPPCSTFLR